MNKEILIISIATIFMLVAISFASAVSSNTMSDEKRDSPLFRVRTRRAIGERLDELKEAIKAKFIGERVFFLPFQWLMNRDDLSLRGGLETIKCTTGSSGWTCDSGVLTCFGSTCRLCQ